MTTTPPSGSGADDEAFARIVAGFGQDSDDPVPRWPVSEDVESRDAERSAPKTSASEGASGPASGLPPSVEPLPGWLEPEAIEDDGHYQPPPPPRLPIPQVKTVVATTTLLLGLLIMFAPFRIGLDDSTPFLLLGLVLTLGGAGMLLHGMRDAPPTDSGPDDGAVV
jgi:hypothetical protein